MLSNQCNDLLVRHKKGCDPVYYNQIKTILVKKTKRGKYKIKINGEGKWINAIYSEDTNSFSYQP